MERTLFMVRLTEAVSKNQFYINHHAMQALVPMSTGHTKVYTSGGEFEVLESVAMVIRQMNKELALVKEVL